MITQEYIAKKLNLSMSTVSRSLKDSPAISEPTKKTVSQMAKKLGYKPRKYSTKQSSFVFDGNGNSWQKHKSIGVLVNANTDNYYYMAVLSPMMEGISMATKELGVSMACHYLSSEDEALNLCSEDNYLPMMKNKDLLGLVYMWPFPVHTMKKLSSEFPSVSINHHYKGVSIPTVTSNQEEGIEIIVNHLYRLGHRKIAFLGPRDPNELLYPRFSGYLSGLRNCNISIDMDLILNVLQVEYNEDRYGEKVMELMKEKGVTAVVAASGACGSILLDQLDSQGINAPEAISVASFDTLVRSDGRKLSGVEAPHKIIGHRAVVELINSAGNWKGMKNNSIIQFSTNFIEGDTIGAIE